LIVLSPVFLLLSLLILIGDGRPVFYSGKRIGKDCKVFKMYKFRSMKVDAPDLRNEDGSTYNSSSDTRVTKVGKFLRETSMDELPQLFNVLKGDMSLIGPRASLADALTSYQTDELDKMRVRPGITGYVQAYHRNGLSAREKRLKDSWYATHVTFLLDVKIFFKTIETIFKREGLYTNQGAYIRKPLNQQPAGKK
jgi:lipopolysaccharide/colanic/teichoic acid biosynthesis glycosyltransferase